MPTTHLNVAKEFKARWEKAKTDAQMSFKPSLEELPVKKHVVLYSDGSSGRL